MTAALVAIALSAAMVTEFVRYATRLHSGRDL